MDEYIKREAAIKAIEKADYTLIANDADDCKADYLREIIESVPAADVAPVFHTECWEKETQAFAEEFCDKYCKFRDICTSEEELEKQCEECLLVRLLNLGV